MHDSIETLRQRYQSLSDDQLGFIAAEGGLTQEAKAVLDRELARRGIRDVRAYEDTLARDEMELKRQLELRDKLNRWKDRFGLAIVLLFFLGGAYRLVFEGNDVGIILMIVSVVVLLAVLLRRYMRWLLSP